MKLDWLGRALRPLRPGVDALRSSRLGLELGFSLAVRSPSFTEGGSIPARFTADGEGSFPGVSWSGLPPQTQSVCVLVEDADIPFVRPVTHLIVHSISPETEELAPGSVPARMRGASEAGWACGRNFLGAQGWTPPAPPPGHGPHRYAFQVFALNARPVFAHPPSRAGLMRRVWPHVVAQGRVIGVYERR